MSEIDDERTRRHELESSLKIPVRVVHIDCFQLDKPEKETLYFWADGIVTWTRVRLD